MRLLVFTIGTLGDLLPHLTLGRALQEAGHQVRICTHGCYQDRVTAAGLEFVNHEAADPRQQMAAIAKVPTRGRLRSIWFQFFDSRGPNFATLANLVELVRESDAMLTGGTSVWHAAAGVGIPVGLVGLSPLHPTGAYPQPLTRCERSLGSWANRWTHRLVGQVFWRRERPHMNRWRATLGLAPLPWFGSPLPPARERIPCFYGFSPILVPPPQDWPANVVTTGFWFPEPPADWKPEPALENFLNSGPAPVAVAFGSLIDADPGRLMQPLQAAVRALGKRLLVLAGWQGDAGLAPDNARFVTNQFVPLRWLLPRAAAFMHHAGAGSTAEALRAGVPALVLPQSSEQRFWARRQFELGVIPRAVDRARADATVLRAALEEALNSPALEQRRQDVQVRIRQENGPARAVQAIQSWLETERFRSRRAKS